MAKNQLDTCKRIKLYEWLRANATQEKIDAARHNAASLAEAATKTLGFPCNDGHTGPLMKILGVKPRRTENASGTERAKRSQERLRRIEALEAAVEEIRKSLGMT